jgi:uncharacterized protein (TIGR00730 family)
MNICVFCSSSDAIAPEYFRSAARLGKEMAINGFNLVYGGANRGLMNAIAESIRAGKGKITGVIPRSLKKYGIAKQGLDKLIVTEDLRSRKSVMESKSDAFIFLPGGIGTLEESMEILTLKQLNFHDKPLVFLNTRGFYNILLKFFDKMEKEKFIKPGMRRLYYVANDEKSAIKYIKNYKPTEAEDKWF